MNIAIYQIQSERDQNQVKFMPLSYLKDHGKAIDPKSYDRVFLGEVACDSLEEVYGMFNMESHPLLHGHSLSISDVVVAEGKAYYCDVLGFPEVDFQEEQANAQGLKVLYIEPGKRPYRSEIPDRLDAMQQAVQGLIEFVPLSDEVLLVCNEEGKINGMQYNRRIENDIIAGPFFLIGNDEEGECRSLTTEEMKQYMDRFYEPENLLDDEIQRHLHRRFDLPPMDY